MTRRITPTLVLCLLGVAAVLASAALGLSAGRPGPAAPPATTVATVAPTVTAAPGYGTPTSPSTPATTPPAAGPIDIAGFAFSGPATVAPGASVSVTNEDGVDHTVTAVDGSFDSGSIAGASQGAITAPTAPGSYEYFCSIHPEMQGTLQVG